MHGLTSQGHKVNLQIIDNEVRAKHKHVIEKDWKITYQITPQKYTSTMPQNRLYTPSSTTSFPS